MIVVRVELWSAVTGEVTEIARMQIVNDGNATIANPRRGDYAATSFIGRDTEALNRARVSRTGGVRNWPRLDRHVWCLVLAALAACGYGKMPPQDGDDAG